MEPLDDRHIRLKRKGALGAERLWREIGMRRGHEAMPLPTSFLTLLLGQKRGSLIFDVSETLTFSYCPESVLALVTSKRADIDDT
jgi:hypothetical protein